MERALQALVKRDTPVGRGSELGENMLTQVILNWISTESTQLGKHNSSRCAAAVAPRALLDLHDPGLQQFVCPSEPIRAVKLGLFAL